MCKGAPTPTHLRSEGATDFADLKALHGADNGRVVGYDNHHGYHHRHYFSVVAAVEFTSFDDIEDQFQIDWTALRNKA